VRNPRSSELNLVTGGSGLLGSHIAEQLRLRGRPVRAVVRRGSDACFLDSIGCELVYGDVTDRDSLKAACDGVATVYHAAARVGDWGPWSDFVRVTIDGTANLIDAAAAAGVARFLHISSISVYGYIDDPGRVVDETAPLGYRLHRWSYYSRAKVQAERLVWEAHHSGRLRVTVIRPSWLYGPRDRATLGRLVDSIRKGKAKLIGDGENRLNVVHAGNVAEAAIAAADRDVAVGQAYNCSNDGVLTQKQYFNTVARAIGAPPVTKSVPYAVAKTAAFVMECLWRLARAKKPPLVTRYSVWLIGRRSFFDTTKARKELGWTSTVSYEDGIPLAVEWYLKHRGGAAPRAGARDAAPASA